jgi:microcompartment protein CcmL/EutN
MAGIAGQSRVNQEEGDVASVQAAVAVGCKVAAEDGMLVGRSVIAAPSEELFRDYL